MGGGAGPGLDEPAGAGPTPGACPTDGDEADDALKQPLPDPRVTRRRRVRLCRPDGTPLSRNELALVRMLIDAIPECTLLVTATHHIAAANAAFLRALRRTAESACGDYCPRTVHGRETPFPGCPLETSLMSGGVTDSELCDEAHGTWVRAIISPMPLIDQRGEAVYLHLVGDITARKRLEALRSALIDQVISTQDAERRRIARELHDETLQVLGALSLRLHELACAAGEGGASADAGAGPLTELRRLVDASADGVRRLARGLHPTLLDDLGLAAALERMAEDLHGLHGLALDVHVAGLDPARPLSRAVQLSLYRIVQEALTNVVRHSGATSASVVVDRQPTDLIVIVEDNGSGLPQHDGRPGARLPAGRGLGLVSIRERVSLLGGTVRIESRPEGGTTLYVQVPSPAEAA